MISAKKIQIENFESGIKLFHGNEKVKMYINAHYGNCLDWCKQYDGSSVLFGISTNAKIIMMELKNNMITC